MPAPAVGSVNRSVRTRLVPALVPFGRLTRTPWPESSTTFCWTDLAQTRLVPPTLNAPAPPPPPPPVTSLKLPTELPAKVAPEVLPKPPVELNVPPVTFSGAALLNGALALTAPPAVMLNDPAPVNVAAAVKFSVPPPLTATLVPNVPALPSTAPARLAEAPLSTEMLPPESVATPVMSKLEPGSLAKTKPP